MTTITLALFFLFCIAGFVTMVLIIMRDINDDDMIGR